MKNALDSAIDQAKKTVADVRDGADEAMHRSAADAEKTRRDVAGNSLTPKEKLVSAASEIQHRTQAEMDRAKRELR